jgi:hypothetical protein
MRQQLWAHLSILIRQGIITLWSDRVILAGETVDTEISANLEKADVILFLVSADFLASNYCYDIEVRRAMELHYAGKVSVVPIILRDCDWQHAPFGKLSAVPTDGRPVRSWPDRDKAYRLIVDRIRALIAAKGSTLHSKPQDLEVSQSREATFPPAAILDLKKLRRLDWFERTEGKDGNPPVEVQSFLKQLSHLVDINDDLDRRSTDAKHVEAGGTINYIFDENIFEIFVKPHEWGEQVALFHAGLLQPKHFHEQKWRKINAQSAVLTGEYLFSASLPGQRGGAIYMTPFHREELIHRAYSLIETLHHDNSGIDVAREFLFRMASFRATIARGAMVTINDPLSTDQESIQSDIQTLRDAGVAEEKINNYLTTRVALQSIVSEHQAASLFQLQRVMDRKFFESIHPVSSLKQPTSDDKREIAEHAHMWFECLAHERQLRVSTQPRTNASLWNDACSLAIANWLATARQDASELTVLVTGDSLLFSAYRRWHVDAPPGKPFLLRRPVQYAPVFTLGDPDVVETPKPQVVDEFVEIALLPLNLSKVGDRRPDVSTQRRHFVQWIRDGGLTGQILESFFPVLKSEWYQRVMKKMQPLGDVWRQLETITLGLNSDLLAYRIATALPDAIAFGPESSSVTARDVDRWLVKMIASLHQQAMALWVPLAYEAIGKLRINDEGERNKGAFWMPYEFRFTGVLHGSAVDLTFKRSREGKATDLLWLSCFPEEADSLLQQPTIAFAVAAFLAGQRRLWIDAERFVKFCVEAAKLEDTSDANLAEAKRLASVISLARNKDGY